MLPFVVLGDVAGLEILHPAAVVVLGGVVTSTLLILGCVPALYLRFGAGARTARTRWTSRPCRTERFLHSTMMSLKT